MKVKIVVLVGIVSVAIAAISLSPRIACLYNGPNQKLTSSLKKEINKEIDLMVKEWDKAAANKDAIALSRLYTEDADIIHYDDIHHSGRESIRRHFENQIANDPKLKKSFTNHNRVFITPEIVVETAKSHITGSLLKPAPPTRGRYTATYVKTDGRWLILYERAWWTWPFKYD